MEKPKRGCLAKMDKADPWDASCGEKEKIVYLGLADLHPFKNHPFGVRDDAEIQELVESVKTSGVNQPALVCPGGWAALSGQSAVCPHDDRRHLPQRIEAARLAVSQGGKGV